MITFIRHHNFLNGLLFSFLEYVIVAAIIAPFGWYYIAHSDWLYAVCAVGIMGNCLTVAAFALVAMIKREPSIGIWKLSTDRALRQKIAAEYPHLSHETLVLSAGVLIPFFIFASVAWDFRST